MDKKIERFDRVFRILAIISIVILVFITPISSVIRKSYVSKYEQIVEEFGKESDEAENNKAIDYVDILFVSNCILCSISIAYFAVYLIGKIVFYKKQQKKIFKKENFIKYWPIIIIALFMIWTALATGMACLEYYAEQQIKTAENIEDVSEFTKSLADFTETDRLSTTYESAWKGNPLHLEGYVTFLYYATVFINVLLLGNNSKNIKKWILRALLITSLYMVVITMISFVNRGLFDIINFDRYVFSNRNYFGHLISIVLMLAICMAIIEKSKIFKAIAFLDCILFFAFLTTNDTFAALIGIISGLAFLFIITLIRLITAKKVQEFVSCLIIIFLFVVMINIFVGGNVRYFTTKGIKYTLSKMYINFAGKTYCYSVNSISEEKAKENGLHDFKYKGTQITFGNKVEVLENRRQNYFEKEFSKLFKQLKQILTGTAENTIDDNTDYFTDEEMERAVNDIGSGRGRLWKNAINIFNLHPIIGWGLDNAKDFDYNSILRSHNIFLQMCITTGSVGATLYFVSIMTMFFGVMFDVKIKKYKPKQLVFFILLSLFFLIVLNVIISLFTDKLLFNYLVTLLVTTLLYAIIFIDKIHLRIKEWNYIEFISSAVFVSYMANNMFGNSTFFTSPYFVIFLGLLAAEKIHKKSFFEEKSNITKEEALSNG